MQVCLDEARYGAASLTEATAVISSFAGGLAGRIEGLQAAGLPLHRSFLWNAHMLQMSLYLVVWTVTTLSTSTYFQLLTKALDVMAQFVAFELTAQRTEGGELAPAAAWAQARAAWEALRSRLPERAAPSLTSPQAQAERVAAFGRALARGSHPLAAGAAALDSWTDLPHKSGDASQPSLLQLATTAGRSLGASALPVGNSGAPAALEDVTASMPTEPLGGDLGPPPPAAPAAPAGAPKTSQSLPSSPFRPDLVAGAAPLSAAREQAVHRGHNIQELRQHLGWAFDSFTVAAAFGGLIGKQTRCVGAAMRRLVARGHARQLPSWFVDWFYVLNAAQARAPLPLGIAHGRVVPVHTACAGEARAPTSHPATMCHASSLECPADALSRRWRVCC